jgi:hypothetical protein
MMSEIAPNHVGESSDRVASLLDDLAGRRASNALRSTIMERR